MKQEISVAILESRDFSRARFIYCLDEEYKDILLSKGYKLLKQESMQDKIAWVFEFLPEVKFDLKDNTKYFVSNMFRF